MKIEPTALDGVLLITPDIHRDARGFFMETYRAEHYATAGIHAEFAQDNVTLSARGVLRGLHYQYPMAQAKLIQVLAGEVFDVAVDIRPASSAFGQWFGVSLSFQQQLYIPAGFAHGFVTVSESALLSYKCSNPYRPQHEGSIRFDDPDIGIRWPLVNPTLSDQDHHAPLLRDIARTALPE